MAFKKAVLKFAAAFIKEPPYNVQFNKKFMFTWQPSWGSSL